MSLVLGAEGVLHRSVSSDPAEPCYATVDGTSPFEEVCYSPLVELTNGFTLRDYSDANALATLYHLHAPASLGTYDYALNETTAVSHNLISSACRFFCARPLRRISAS